MSSPTNAATITPFDFDVLRNIKADFGGPVTSDFDDLAFGLLFTAKDGRKAPPVKPFWMLIAPSSGHKSQAVRTFLARSS